MMARASGSIPTYTPSLYLPGSIGRFRQYPRVVRTPIPGAGVRGGRLVWGEQVLNLWGAPRVAFSASRLPLLGLGQISLSAPVSVPPWAIGLGLGGAFAAGWFGSMFMSRRRG